MAESIDIRELNERIERQKVLSLPILRQVWTKSLLVRNIWLNHCLSDYFPMVTSSWKVCPVWRKLWLLRHSLL